MFTRTAQSRRGDASVVTNNLVGFMEGAPMAHCSKSISKARQVPTGEFQSKLHLGFSIEKSPLQIHQRANLRRPQQEKVPEQH